MFNSYAHAAVDMVQYSKKSFVDAFVQYDAMKNVLNNFIDSQTAYTKTAIDAGISASTQIGSILMSKQFYDQMYDGVKAYMPVVK